MTELCIRNTRLLAGGISDIAIDNGHITAMGADLDVPTDSELDAEGGIALPGFVNAHLHVDKALTVGEHTKWIDRSFQESVDLTLENRKHYSHEDLIQRGSMVLEDSMRLGCTTIRAFADVGTVGGLTGAKALMELRDIYRGLIDLQVCAFPQEGLIRDPGTEELLAEAMNLGCDLVGGFPWFEYTPEYENQHINTIFQIARKFDSDIHMFVDDEPIAPQSRGLETLAEATIDNGWEGRVTVSHACALASYDDHLADRVCRLVATAGISVISNAHLSLVSKCQHAAEPRPRGITRVTELLAKGVNVATAQDDIADPYYPFGRGDMLEVASFIAHVAQLYRPEDTSTVIDMVTVNPAKALRLDDYGLKVGSTADIQVFPADSGSTATELIRLQPPRRWVFKEGVLVASTSTTSKVQSPMRQQQ
jgi:cytosine deaminase|tara:strand:- start:211 stop:1476 length:1266 start_codon:yes stop_codon:yes gene_type:complete